MGLVWEGEDIAAKRRIALKFLKAPQQEARRRFLREVRAAAAVEHPNVVKIHDFVTLEDETLVIVMELLVGETLDARLKRRKRLPLGEAAAILLPVIDALTAAHGLGIIHRDLKPENIFIEADRSVKVVDFGVAKLTAEDGLAARTQALTDTGSMVGTPYYMSPEQVFSEKDIDVRADVWSLGVVLYECLAGVRPTEDENVGRVLRRIMKAEFEPISKHCEGLPADVVDLLTRMLAGEKESRPADAAAVRTALEPHAKEIVVPDASALRLPHLADRAVEPRNDTNAAVSISASNVPRPRRRSQLLFGGIGALLLLSGGGFIAQQMKTPVPVQAQAAVIASPPPPPAVTTNAPAAAPAPLATEALDAGAAQAVVPRPRPTSAVRASASANAIAAPVPKSSSPAQPKAAVDGVVETPPF